MAFTQEQLDHIVLTVANIHATTDFYTEALGMDIVTCNGGTPLKFGEPENQSPSARTRVSSPRAPANARRALTSRIGG